MRKPSSRAHQIVAVATLLTTLSASRVVVRTQGGATIHVTTTTQGVVNDGQCSLQEAIYSANFNSATVPTGFDTGCEPGSGDDVIELQPNAVYDMKGPFDDPYNPLGPTATPIVLSHITIEAHGAELRRANPARDFSGLPNFRAFAVAYITTACVQLESPLQVFRRDLDVCGADPLNELGLGNTRGDLTLRNAYVVGFTAKGGDGALGGGGGLGAGGAIFVAGGVLTIENSTFQDNGAGGGNGSRNFGRAGGGGGGLGGNGGVGNLGGGGGGGGSRGNGADGDDHCGSPCLGLGAPGGGGGGTLRPGVVQLNTEEPPSALRCGGKGGYVSGESAPNPLNSPRDGKSGDCPGGGGGGGRDSFFLFGEVSGGNGGDGAYGAGGGGGAFNLTWGDGGDGGFGGGGGGAYGASGNIPSGFGPSGGNGNFGGGGGAGHGGFQPIGGGGPGKGGSFAGSADAEHGGGGGALGGAIFGDNAQITILNSTFYANYALRGLSAGGDANSGRGAGGGIFTVDGSLRVLNSTIYRNETTTDGGGLVVYRSTRDGSSASLTLLNTLIAQNTSLPGRGECYVLNSVSLQAARNLITNNETDALTQEFDGSPYRDPRACPGHFVSLDPELQPLRMNVPGLTPTLAILPGSSAADVADPSTSLATDQRGVDRPFGDGWDIGAYEARTPDFLLQVQAPTAMELGETVSIPIKLSSVDNFTGTLSLAFTHFHTEPTELDASLDVTAVAITPDQPGFATATVHAGTDVVGGVQSLELSAGSENGLVKQVIMSITVAVSPGGMMKTIDDLRSIGDIANAGVATALTSKLAVAQRLIDNGDVQAGVNTLAAFGFQVRALSGKQIATDAAGRLLANLDLLLTKVAPQARPNPLIGTVTDAAGLPVGDVTVTILNGKSIVASAATDATGFYYVARTTSWLLGASYSTNIALPKGYKRATPSLLTFTWTGSMVVLPTQVLSK